MPLAHKASLTSSNVLHRLISTSATRLKAKGLPKLLKAKDAIDIPPVPKLKSGSFSEKLQRRLIAKSAKSTHHTQMVLEKEAFDDMTGTTTGWGADALAPPAVDREKPSHNPKVDLKTVQRFEREAYYRHGRDLPHFDRRIHLWVNGNSDEPALKKIETDEPQPPLAQLSHSLDRVLFNPGPHWLKDPRTHVYNFDQWLEDIPDIHNFDYERLTPYVTSSRDNTLFSLMKPRRETVRRIYFVTNQFAIPHLFYDFRWQGNRYVSPVICIYQRGKSHYAGCVNQTNDAHQPREFSYGARWPGGIILQHKDDHYCVDSQEVDDSEKNLLLNMGTMLEKFLTQSPSEFNLLLRDTPITEDLAKLQRPEAYQYSTSEKFVMRSQLDAHDSRLPGSGVFDIKTRAAVAIRYDPLNYKNNSGYLIKTEEGAFESFEREYYDLIRAAFLKYVFQVRIGGMDGIFVAYHNTAYMFGFQYISREDMDNRLFGGPIQGDRVFQKCVKCLEEIMSEVVLCFPGVSINCFYETSVEENALRLYVEPTEWDQAGERPIVELLVTATNYVNGERVLGPMDFGDKGDDWSILLNITRSSTASKSLQSSIRQQRDSLVERKNEFAFSMPQGVTPTEMAKQWLNMDYRAKSNGDNEGQPTANLSAQDAEKLEELSLKFKGRNRPSDFVESLRRLAKEGREYLDELKASSTEETEHSPLLLDTLDKDDAGFPEDADARPLATDGFSRDIDATASLDNSVCYSEYNRPASEEGLVEQLYIDVPVEETSVHVKLWQEATPTGERGKDETHSSTEVGVGKNPVENDNRVPPRTGEIDHSEAPVVLGSEEDELDMLDPTKEGDINISDQPVSFAEGGPEDEVEVLDASDEAWSTTRSPPSSPSRREF